MLDVAAGEIITHCKPRHRHQEFLRFARQIEKSVPDDLVVHLIVDNYCAHKHVKVSAWLVLRPRFDVQYTPTHASWLKQVERWFGLIAKIEQFVAVFNKTKAPFNWTATGDSILEKLQHLSSQISGTGD
jgi:putative transposase